MLPESGGFTLRKMMLLLPRRRICSWASKLAPSPTASMAITEHTPNTMPNTVSRERRRWSHRLLNPRIMVRRRRAGAKGLVFTGFTFVLSIAYIRFYESIAQPDHALGMVTDFVIVGHHDNRFSLTVEIIEKGQNLSP